jgi:HEAT repeat protein
LRVLEHEPTPDIQADAAEALADWVATLPDRAVVSALIQQALPPDRGDLRRRIQANLSIAKLSTDDLRQVLQCRSDPEWTLEITAAHAEGHPELLKPFLETAGGEHRERTARLLRHFTDNPEAGAVLRNALHDPDAAVRKEAADSLGYLPPDPESIRALDGLLNDSSEEVRHAAALAIQALRSK